MPFSGQTHLKLKDLPPASLETQRHGEDEDEKIMFNEFS
jgi:hypothetical protein